MADPRDRLWYAQVILNRLLLVYDLQLAGWLGGGDRWYLHTQLGLCQQQHPDRFYRTFLLPLCHEGLGLPAIERPLTTAQLCGPVPYLGGRLFQPHPLELKYPELDLLDAPFESCLGWLAEQSWQRTATHPDPAVLTRTRLAAALEYETTDRTGKAIATATKHLQTICEQTLDAYLLQRLSTAGLATPAPLDDILVNLSDPICHFWVDQVLPSMTVLDPACGSGRFLLMALDRLQTVYSRCYQHAQQSAHPALQTWAHSLAPDAAPLLWQITSTILTHHLYGVDSCPIAIEVTQLQLWLAWLTTVPDHQIPPPLPDLAFNITVGNALVGFIRVDEEGFDQIQPKKPPLTPSSETVLQGNLLQPLTAASYRDTLAERRIHIEHYQAQTRAMAEASDIPEYVQVAFLRDRITAVNQTAQLKLNRLLLETFSQKWGVRLQEPRLTATRPRRRLLALEDITALNPFHWGFFFNTILSQRGGFDVVLTHPPTGNLTPSADAFYTQEAALCQQYGISQAVFRRSRKALLLQYPDLAARWATYAGRLHALRDYVRRSDAYPDIAPHGNRRIPLAALFAQRCRMLAHPHSIAPYLHHPES